MKKLLLSLSILFTMGFVSQTKAQTLNIGTYTPVTVSNDNMTPSDSHIEIINNTNDSVHLTVIRTVNYIVPGMLELFCTGLLCYNPGTDTSTTPVAVEAGGTTDLKSTILPNGTWGNASMHYRIFDVGNPADSVTVDVAFTFSATGLNENTASYGISRPTRNPADAFTVFNYNLQSNAVNDKVVIYNMLGSLVRTIDIPARSGSLVLSTSDLKSGVYFVSYMNGGRLSNTSKLVVSHR